MNWRYDPAVLVYDQSHEHAMKDAVAAYQRCLADEIGKLPAEPNDFGYDALLVEDVLALIRREGVNE